jgi:catechol 2,3-dioxygenase-like lactoylglutathione lyase family enzyme
VIRSAAPARAFHADPLVVGLQSVGRQVADLDRSVRFYQAAGFELELVDDASWTSADERGRLFATGAATCRSARLRIPSAVSGQPFALVLREFGGIERNDWSGLDMWSLGSGHLGLGVEDPAGLIASLRERVHPRILTSGGEPLTMPDDLAPPGGRPVAFVAFLDPDGGAIEVQPPRQPASESPRNVAFAAQDSGFNHVNVNVFDHAAAESFFSLLNVRFPSGSREWLIHWWLDGVFGLPGDGNGWKIVNGETPEAVAYDSRMLFELIAFKEFDDRSHLARMRFADVNITSLCFEVQDVPEARDKLLRAGAAPWSAAVVETGEGAAAVVRDPHVGTFIELRDRFPAVAI